MTNRSVPLVPDQKLIRMLVANIGTAGMGLRSEKGGLCWNFWKIWKILSQLDRNTASDSQTRRYPLVYDSWRV